MKQLCAVLLPLPLAASAQEVPAGLWALEYLRPGVVEAQAVHLRIQPGEADPLEAELWLSGEPASLRGRFDPATERLELAGVVDGNPSSLVLGLSDGILRGEAKLPGRTLPVTGKRVEALPPAPRAVDFGIERPRGWAWDALEPAAAASLASALEDWAEGQPAVGLSVALAAGGGVVDVWSLGWEDFASRRAASERTRYRWASVSKPLTAVAVLQLAAAGKLDLEADVRRRLPEYDKGVPLTARQLLAHRGGVPHYAEMRVRTPRRYDRAHPWTDPIVALDMFSESDLVAAPGERYRYTTAGYVVLGALVQRCGEGTYAEQVRVRIAEPLAMTSLVPEAIWDDIPRRTTLYSRRGEGAVEARPDDISWKLAGGGWLSTAADMARFGLGLMGEGVLDAEGRDRMRAVPEGNNGYALGLRVGRRGERVTLAHSGSQVGTSTFLLCAPESGHAVALMANTDGLRLDGLAGEVLDRWIEAATAGPAVSVVETLCPELAGGAGGLEVDAEGWVYCADFGGSLGAGGAPGTRVYRIDPQSGQAEVFADGLRGASGNAIGPAGDFYQSNIGAGTISRITPEGQASLFLDRQLRSPVGLVFDAQGNLYAANCGAGNVLRVTPAGEATVFAASPLMACPNGLTLDGEGNLYVSNFSNGDVLRVTADGEVSVLATLPGNNNGHLAFHRGALLVVARADHRIYRVSLDGEVEVFAGSGARGHDDGPLLEASFSFPNDLAVSPDGRTLYVNENASTTAPHSQLAPMTVRRIRLAD